MKTLITIILLAFTLSAQVMSFEDSVVEEMNLVRTNPVRYAEAYIIPILNDPSWGYYTDGNGKTWETNNLSGKYLYTIEGKAAVRECIRYLTNHRILPPLNLSKEMSLAARDHIEDHGPKGRRGHLGTMGSTPAIRAERYGHWTGSFAENIDYSRSTPRDIVISLLIDDGVPSRGHRNTILSHLFNVTGVAKGYHKTYGVFCVINYSTSFTSK